MGSLCPRKKAPSTEHKHIVLEVFGEQGAGIDSSVQGRLPGGGVGGKIKALNHCTQGKESV